MVSYDKFEETEAYQHINKKHYQNSFITITPFSYNDGEEEEIDSRQDSLHCSENILESPYTSYNKKQKDFKLDRYRQFIIQFHSDTKEMISIFNQLKSIQSFIESQIIFSEKELSNNQKILQDLLYEDNQKQAYVLQLQIVNQQIQEKEKIQKYLIKKQRQVSFMDLPESPKDEPRLKNQYYQQPTSTSMSTQISYQHQMTQSARLHQQDKIHNQNKYFNQSFNINNYPSQENVYNLARLSPKNGFISQASYHKQLKSKSKSETVNLLQNKFGSAPFKMQINNNQYSQNGQYYQHRHYPLVSQFN